MGEIEPFTPEKPTARYGYIQNPRALTEHSADRLIREGFCFLMTGPSGPRRKDGVYNDRLSGYNRSTKLY